MPQSSVQGNRGAEDSRRTRTSLRKAQACIWKRAYDVLEDTFPSLVVNAVHMHDVSERKTDIQDRAWSAQLLEFGLSRRL